MHPLAHLARCAKTYLLACAKSPQFCRWLMTKTYTCGIRTALEKMVLQLMEEADAVEKEKALRITTVPSF
jgi:hypothetical protein